MHLFIRSWALYLLISVPLCSCLRLVQSSLFYTLLLHQPSCSSAQSTSFCCPWLLITWKIIRAHNFLLISSSLVSYYGTSISEHIQVFRTYLTLSDPVLCSCSSLWQNVSFMFFFLLQFLSSDRKDRYNMQTLPSWCQPKYPEQELLSILWAPQTTVFSCFLSHPKMYHCYRWI